MLLFCDICGNLLEHFHTDEHSAKQDGDTVIVDRIYICCGHEKVVPTAIPYNCAGALLLSGHSHQTEEC